jgi:hypothetical protein
VGVHSGMAPSDAGRPVRSAHQSPQRGITPLGMARRESALTTARHPVGGPIPGARMICSSDWRARGELPG